MNRLTELRAERDLTQTELAKIMNVARNTVSQWESSKREPDLKTLVKLANYFDVSVDYLIGNEVHEQQIALQPNYTDQQKKCLSMISELSDTECMQVITYIKTMQEIKKNADMETLRILRTDKGD